MSKKDSNIHVLIEGARTPTSMMWDNLGRKPEIWTANIIGHPYQMVSSRKTSENIVFRPKLNLLVGGPRVVNSTEDLDIAQKDFEDLIMNARRRHGLTKNTRLQVALVGSHTTAADFCTAALSSPLILETNLNGYFDYVSWAKAGRAFINSLYYNFKKHSDLMQVRWLNDASTLFQPKISGSDLSMQIAQFARSNISRITSVKFGNIQHIKRPTLPFILIHDQKSGRLFFWESKSGRGGLKNPLSSHTKLLETFVKEGGLLLSGTKILVKLLGHNLTDQNPMDPPIITDKVLDLASKSGISVILLDSRVGVVFAESNDLMETVKIVAV